MTTPITTRFRFEATVEAIAPDGTRTRLSVMQLPPTCLVCGRSVIGDDLRMLANTATVNGRFGFACSTHPGTWRGV